MGWVPFLGRMVRETVYLGLGLLNFHAPFCRHMAAQITDKVCFQKRYCQNEKNASSPSLPCVKGGAEERGGGIVKYINLIKNNPSVALRQLPLHKGASLFCAN